jgi:WD40 repeat protein
MIAGQGWRFCGLFILVSVCGSHSPAAAADKSDPAAPPAQRRDSLGDPLPEAAIARIGSLRFWHGSQIHTLGYSTDGTRLLSAGHNSIVRLWDATSGKLIRAFGPHEGRVTSAVLTRDGKTLYSIDTDRKIHRWDVASGKLLGQWKGSSDQHHATPNVAVAPDGKTIACGGERNAIHLWDPNGKEIRLLTGLERGAQALSFSPDGRILAAKIDGRNGCILWDTTSGKRLRYYDTRFADESSILFTPDGQRLVFFDRDNVMVYDVFSIDEIGRVNDAASSYTALAIAGKAKMFASMSQNHVVRIGTLDTVKEIAQFNADKRTVRAIDLSPDGKTLATGNDVGQIHLWDTATGKERVLFDAPDEIGEIGFTPDGRNLLTVGGRSLRFWDLDKAREQQRLELPDGEVLGLSPDQRTLVMVGSDHEIRLLDIASGKETQRLKGPTDKAGGLEHPRDIMFSPDGKLLGAIGQTQNDGRFWEVGSGKLTHNTSFTNVGRTALSPDGRIMASADGRPTPLVRMSPRGGIELIETTHIQRLHLWELASGKVRRSIAIGNEDDRINIFDLKYSPDAKLLALAADSSVRVYDPIAGKLVSHCDGHGRNLCAIAFSPDGNLLASGSQDRTVRFWNPASGAELARLEGHGGAVQKLVFSIDGKRLASTGEDGTVVVWDVAAAVQLARRGELRSPARIDTLWAELAGDDAERAGDAVRALARTPAETVTFLKAQLRPVSVDAREIRALIQDLDSENFAAREKAAAELKQRGAVVRPILRQALGAASPEVKRRVEVLLKDLEKTTLTGHELRCVRAVEVLERLATPEARKLLDQLAAGAAEAPQTREAKLAVERLEARSKRRE